MKRLFMVFAVLCALQAAIAGAASFKDNGNGTVSDSDTGLMWQQGEPGLMIWADALTYCETLSLGGQADWRLPNLTELESLVDYSISYPGPTINTTYFPNIYASYYWSSTTYAYDTSLAWFVYFYDASVTAWYKSSNDYVRCVRGGQ